MGINRLPRELHPLKVAERKLQKNPVFVALKDNELHDYLTSLPLNVRQAHELFTVIATYHNQATLQDAKMNAIKGALNRTHSIDEFIW